VRLGIGSFSYPWAIGVPKYPQLPEPMDAFLLLEAAAFLGAQAVEYDDNLSLTHLSERQLIDLSARAAAAKIEIEVGMRGTDPSDIRTHLELVKRLKGSYLRIMTDDLNGDRPNADIVIERLIPLVSEFEDSGIKMALENSDHYTAYDLIGIVEALGEDAAGVCLDTINCFGAGEGPSAVIETFAPYTLVVHLKDFMVRRQQHRLGFVIEGEAVGQGQLDVPALLAQMPEGTSIILEPWTPWTGDLEAACREEALRVEQGIAYLKPLLH